MKRKKYSKKVHKNKIFRKKAYKTYKSSRSPSHRLHRGGAIDWGRAQSKTPGSPKQKLPSPPPLTESLKRLLSEKGEGEGIKRDSSPIKYLHKSEKTPSQIQSKKNTPKKTSSKKNQNYIHRYLLFHMNNYSKHLLDHHHYQCRYLW